MNALSVVDEHRAMEMIDHKVSRFYDHSCWTHIILFLCLSSRNNPLFNIKQFPLDSKTTKIIRIIVDGAIKTDFINSTLLSEHNGI